MTTKDKTGDQLVASMRKSKTGSVASKTAAPATKDNPAAVKPQTEAKPSATTAGTAKKRQQPGTRSRDNYSIGRRVWPD